MLAMLLAEVQGHAPLLHYDFLRLLAIASGAWAILTLTLAGLDACRIETVEASWKVAVVIWVIWIVAMQLGIV
jgi:hypothetical protein